MNAREAQVRKVIGTAGHIDHGKTSLVRALTGRDPDRLPEERRRGMTLDLGFAWTDIPPHGTVGIVDVPGHEGYVRHMLAGASGIDVGLMVIAADDGVMPQTREHADILALLGVPGLVCAMTKIDAVPPDLRALAADDIRSFLAGTSYTGAPIVPVSAQTGAGIEELRRALGAALSAAARRGADAGFRLPIDRSFVLLGIGCVVTGTVWSGGAAVGEEAELLPPSLRVKIRQIQAHEHAVPFARAGQRTAINLGGVKAQEVLRGYTLAAPGAFRAWPHIDAALALLPSAPRPLAPFARVRVHLGTASALARVVLPRGTQLAPGARGVCQLRLEEPMVAARGDRLVIRRESPVATLGGGTVLLPDSARLRPGDAQRFQDLAGLAGGDLDDAVRVLYKWSGHAPPAVEDLAAALNEQPSSIRQAIERLRSRGALAELPNGILLEHGRAAALSERLRAELELLHRGAPARPHFTFLQIAAACKGAAEPVLEGVLRRLAAQGAIVEARGGFALAGRAPTLNPAETRIRAAIAAEHDARPFSPESPGAMAAALGCAENAVLAQYRLLVEAAEYTQIAPGIFFRADTLRKAEAAIRALAARMGAFAVKDFRDELGTSRKHAVPLLEYFDKLRVTARRPDSTRELAP
jgi:selenocysteine-specific elongation factor